MDKKRQPMKNLLMSGGKLLLAGTMLTSFTNRVNAAATLTIYDGVNPLITVVDNGPGDMIGAIGAILVQTNVGVWNLDINTAITKPLFGSATAPVMDLSVQASSTAAGSLRFVFSDNGFGPASGLLSAIVTGHVVSGAPTTVTYDVYGDPANVVGATTVDIASAGTTALPTTATGSGPLALPAPFSLTQVETFVASGATSIIADASFQVVPEPGVMGLGALGLAVFALGRPRRRQA
jgi:MYXO-CTERM domain-containing protein